MTLANVLGMSSKHSIKALYACVIYEERLDHVSTLEIFVICDAPKESISLV
jgi:hypothetical protein